MFIIVVLFSIAKKKPKYPSADEIQCIYPYTGLLFSNKKK